MLPAPVTTLHAVAPAWPGRRDGLAAALGRLDRVLMAFDNIAGGDRALDAEIYALFGWTVSLPRGRRDARCVSPWAMARMRLPRPTARLDHATAVVPHGWSFSVGRYGGHARAWCHDDATPRGEAGARWAECNAATLPLALTKAGLHGHRTLILHAMETLR